MLSETGTRFFPLRIDPILDGLCYPRKQTGSHSRCPHLEIEMMEKNGKSMNVYP